MSDANSAAAPPAVEPGPTTAGGRRRATPRRWMALMLGLTPLSVLGAAADCDNLNGIPEIPNVLWADVWHELNERASCTQNCHGGSQAAAELDLSSQQLSIYFLVGQPSAQDSFAQRVVPGNPAASLLFRKVNCQQPGIGVRMPIGGHLPVDLQALIYDWIAQGALGEPAEDPIERSFIFIDSLESRQCRRSPDRVDSNCPRNGEIWEGSDK